MFEADVGRAIAKLRGSRTRRSVAAKAGIRPGVWSRHERGQQTPRPQTLQKILKGLGCTPEQFEEEVCQQRAARLAATTAELIPETSPDSSEPADPQSRQLREHLQQVAHHASEVLLLFAKLVRARPKNLHD